MTYGVLFLVLGTILCLQATFLGGWYWILVWPGLSFVVVGSAYLWFGPCVFGKRPDGTIPWYTVALLLPYLVLTWLTWHLVRLTSREDCCNQVAPGLYVGRRPFAAELPKDVTLVVDLTSEFVEVYAVRTGRDYLAAPILDASVCSQAEFERIVRVVADWSGPVYIHCAQGHGRTGMVAAAVLVAKRQAATVEEAVVALKRIRPGLALGQQQLTFVKRVCGQWPAKAASENASCQLGPSGVETGGPGSE